MDRRCVDQENLLADVVNLLLRIITIALEVDLETDNSNTLSNSIKTLMYSSRSPLPSLLWENLLEK